jgi:hypothetical protein
VVYAIGNNVDVYPFLVEAANENEAIGKATKIGNNLSPKGCEQQVVKVGKTTPVTLEAAFIGE